MRVLYCSKYNYRFSGTETFLFDLIRRVEGRGHQAALFSMDHRQPGSFDGRSYLTPCLDFKDPSAGLFRKARLAAHALYSVSARWRIRSCISDFRPDVAHVRGIYHHLSPSILWELKRQGVPVLYHVNDFKLLCPTYNFVAHGDPCEACSSGRYYRALTRHCYGDGRIRSAVLVAEAYLHRWLGTYSKCVDLFLAPSHFVRMRLMDAGLEPERIEVLPHFQSLPTDDHLQSGRRYILYFGRLSAEKGLDDLLHAMTKLPYIPLFIAGDGPERARLETLAQELNLTHVFFTGSLSGHKLERLIAGCQFSVFPSRAYETFGKSILESYAWGRPVVASDRGSRRELVEHGVTGVLYCAGDNAELAREIAYLFNHPEVAARMGAKARQNVREQHDPERYLNTLLGIYCRIARRRSSVPVARMPSSRLRIAFIGGRGVVSKYSGVESYYEHVGRELVRLGHDVTVYCRTYFTPPMAEYDGVRIRRLPTVRTKHLETLVHTLLSTIHATFSKYDIVHYQCLGPALFSFLPRLMGKKTVVTVQGLDWQRNKWGRIAARILRWGDAAAVSFPNATMVVSKTLQTYYREHYRRETSYVPNGTCIPITPRIPTLRTEQKGWGTHLDEWNLIPDNYLLYLGRFSPEKNCHLLIDAFESLPSDMKLVLAGGTSHTDTYVEGLHQRASERIRFLSWKEGEELEELLSNAAIFVLASDIEGLSLALLDAMAAGVCVLTSDIPENREVVEGAGFMFERGNQSDLARVLCLLMNNPVLRRQTGRKAQERIRECYLWPGIARAIEECYHELLGRKLQPQPVLAMAASARGPRELASGIPRPAA